MRFASLYWNEKQKFMIEFAQPTALWTGLLIGLPVLAHMAYRRVTEKFYFPSLRFIRPSQIPRTGKRTLLIFHCYF